MTEEVVTPRPLRMYRVWDKTTRWFHWINVLCVIGLIGLGLCLLNANTLGVSAEGKILLKTLHAYAGYVFVLNLVWRLLWGFIGNRHARWRSILPMGKAYWRTLPVYVSNLWKGRTPRYLGHNPLGRLMVTLMFALLSLQAASGLVLAGTDLFLPPFGHEIAEWVTGSGEDHAKLAQLKPGVKEGLDPAAYAEMRSFREPVITLHLISFYVILVAIGLHILAVVVTEVAEKSGLISAMFSGRKVLSEKPADVDE
ncbi:MAG: cytochrome b/b6 domain-containing protein [Steroidobacteraceae bacterium]